MPTTATVRPAPRSAMRSCVDLLTGPLVHVQERVDGRHADAHLEQRSLPTITARSATLRERRRPASRTSGPPACSWLPAERRRQAPQDLASSSTVTSVQCTPMHTSTGRAAAARAETAANKSERTKSISILQCPPEPLAGCGNPARGQTSLARVSRHPRKGFYTTPPPPEPSQGFCATPPPEPLAGCETLRGQTGRAYRLRDLPGGLIAHRTHHEFGVVCRRREEHAHERIIPDRPRAQACSLGSLSTASPQDPPRDPLDWVQMDVAAELQHISIGRNRYPSGTPLEKGAAAPVLLVEGLDIATEQPLEERRQHILLPGVDRSGSDSASGSRR